MSDDEHKKLGLLPPRPVLKRLNWSHEYRQGADESVDDPPLFSSENPEASIDESLSVDFGWPSLSTMGHRLEHTLPEDPTTEGFVPDVEALQSSLSEASNARAIHEAEQALSDLSRIPRLLMNEPDLVWQRLNHQEGYVLSQIDGQTSFADLIEIAGLPSDKIRRILLRLLRSGVIG